MSVSVSSLFPIIRTKYLFTVTSLKQEQNDIIERVVAKKDVFAFYPTGFGKSLMYLCTTSRFYRAMHVVQSAVLLS